MKAPLSIVRCGELACAPPAVVADGRILSTIDSAASREALLLWPAAPPRRVLLVKKWRDADARDAAVELGDWLLEELGVALFVHEDDGEDAGTRFPARFARYAPPSSPTGLATPPAGAAAGDDIDVIVSLGGDGTVLHVSWLFQAAMPPVVAIAFGSLGFMTVHSLSSCTDVLARILAGGGGGWAAAASAPEPPVDGGSGGDGDGGGPLSLRTPAASPQPQPGIPVSLRMRLRVEVRRAGCAPSSPPEVAHVVLNELLLERGPSPYMATLVAYVDDEPLTTVAADGLIVATQTGSTAYSLSAGGSILSPNTAAIVFTPICPHTLSFRPLLFPDSAAIRLEVPADARSSAWCSFDGRHSMELRAGDYVLVRSSPFPLPLVCRRSATGDWVRAIKCKLYWNVRERQKAFQRPPPFAAGASGAAVASERRPSAAPPAAPQPPLPEPLPATAPAMPQPAALSCAPSAAPAAAPCDHHHHHHHQHSPPGSPLIPASRRASDALDASDAPASRRHPGAVEREAGFVDALDAALLSAASCRRGADPEPAVAHAVGVTGGDMAAAQRAPACSACSTPGRAASWFSGGGSQPPTERGQLGVGGLPVAGLGGLPVAALDVSGCHHHQDARQQLHLARAPGAVPSPACDQGDHHEGGVAAASSWSTPLQLAARHRPPPSTSGGGDGGESESELLSGQPSEQQQPVLSTSKPAREWRFIKPSPVVAVCGAAGFPGSATAGGGGSAAPLSPVSHAASAAAPPPAAQQRWLGSEHALDYPDAQEFDSDRLQLGGVSAAAQARPARGDAADAADGSGGHRHQQ